MKKIVIAFISVVLLLFVTSINSAMAATRYMSAEDAKNFISFIYNSDSNKVTYEAMEKDIFYKLLVGGYSNNPDYEEDATAAFLSFMEAHIDQYLSKAGVAVKDSHQYLIDYFKKVADAEDENLAKDICKENVTNSVIALCEGEDAFAIANGLTDALENPLKYYEEMKLISSALTYAYGQNVVSLYTYFDSAKSCMYLKSTPGAYETAMSYNIMALRESNFLSYASMLIPGMTSWEQWIDKMDYWAEYVYDMKNRLASGSFEETHIVVYISNCDEIEDVINWYASGELKAPKMEREGYILEGWYFDKECTEGPIKNGYMITEDLVIYAKWTPRYYTITFHSNCSSVADYSYKLDRLNPEFTEPEMKRKGYRFDGWCWDSACKNPVKGEFTVTGDMHFYADWTCRYDYTIKNGEATITDCRYWETDENGKITGRVELPEEVAGYPVKSVEFDGWLNGVRTVIFPDSMEEIPAWALNYSISVENVILGKNIKKIGKSAFANCSKLTSITLNQGLEEICDSAFSNAKITEITIPDTVTKLDSCLASCDNLESVIIPDSVTYMDGVFWGCESLKTVYIGKGVATISDDVFYDCQKLEAINVSAENKYFASENGILYGKDKTVIYKYPAKKQGTEFIIPSSVKELAASSFAGCTQLEYVNIPDSISKIPEKAFDGCTGLVTCIMPDWVKIIGEYAFEDCENLENVNISKGLTEIGDCAFAQCKKIKSVVLPDGLEYFGSAIFSGCTALENVNLPQNITEVGSSMFYRCENLKEITIPETVTSIGYGAFCGCYKLKEIKIPKTVTYIAPEAFGSCRNLESLIIPEGITRLDYYTIYRCEKMKYIVLPKSLKQIDYGNFSGGLTLENVYYMGTEEDFENIYVSSWENEDYRKALVRCNPQVIAELADVNESDTAIGGSIAFPKLSENVNMFVAVFDGDRFAGCDYVPVTKNSQSADFEIGTQTTENSNIKAFFWDAKGEPEINAITYSK